MSAFLLLLGLLGAATASAADVIVVKAVKYPQHAWWMVLVGSALIGLGGPIWYVMARRAGGRYVEPAIAWTLASTVTVLIAVTVCDGRQSPRQWLGLALILIGALVRG